jgi:hypothetical protein
MLSLLDTSYFAPGVNNSTVSMGQERSIPLGAGEFVVLCKRGCQSWPMQHYVIILIGRTPRRDTYKGITHFNSTLLTI